MKSASLALGIAASLTMNCGVVSQGGPAVFLNATAQLPDDPNENRKDTLGLKLVDVDDDGDLDIFLAEGSAGPFGFPNLLWINDGLGNFADQSASRLPMGASNSVVPDFADIDGDGDVDGVLATVGANELMINDGAGNFTFGSLPQATPPGPPGISVPFPPFFIEVTIEASFVDVDADGDPDILLANENPFFLQGIGPPGDFNRLLINDGSGVFTDESAARLPREIRNTTGHVAGDLDGDGDLDVIEGNLRAQNRILINRGGGFFDDETAVRMPVRDDATRRLALADIDGDGDLDLAVANSRGEQNRLYLNDGLGVFSDVTVTHLPVDSSTSNDVDFEDLDSDGDVDLFITSSGGFVSGHGFLGEPNVMLFNDGSGRFTDDTFPRFEQRDNRSLEAEFGDLDGDGVRDLVVANSGGVDQIGLPPPDGVDELFLRRDCSTHPALCVREMLIGLRTEINGLDVSAFPNGDMASTRERVNQYRKAVLRILVRGMQRALDRGRAHQVAFGLLAISAWVDGERFPRDWVVGPAAERMLERIRFARNALGH